MHDALMLAFPDINASLWHFCNIELHLTHVILQLWLFASTTVTPGLVKMYSALMIWVSLHVMKETKICLHGVM